MRVRIERRGGLAGRPAVGEREDSELTAAERAALHGLLASPPPSRPAPGADRFHYKVQIEHEGKTSELEVPDDAMPEALTGIPKIKL